MSRLKPACTTCGHVHSSRDAVAIGLFGNDPVTYVAATASTPPRPTRAEAEADECAWRQTRPRTPSATIPPGEPVSRAVAEGPDTPAPFPAAAMETAARAKAWCDFLAQVRTSLLVWDIDASIHGEIEHVVDWLRRCSRELVALVDR